MIAIIDYGMGNLRSVQKAFEKVGAKALITQDANELARADKIVLPGVGAIKPSMDKLASLEFIDPLKNEIKKGKPFLGICLGFQLLFESSDEGGMVEGLGILKGCVKRFNAKGLKIPQMGWNQLNIKQTDCPLYKGIDNNVNVYFCHSFYVEPQDKTVIATTTDYGSDFTSSVSVNNIYGVQFHPEKSQKTGLTILKNFTEINA